MLESTIHILLFYSFCQVNVIYIIALLTNYFVEEEGAALSIDLKK